jgi:Zn-dependent peptidase ImmA (M78 family)
MARGGDFLHRATDEFCRRRARELLEELGLAEPPVRVEEVARDCGLQVRYVRRGRGFSGQLLREQRVIEIERDIHPHRQRFTLAHEIGHYVLNHSPVFCVFDDVGTYDPAKANERQAQVFASELLMPEPWIRKYWTMLHKDYKALARAFFVSDEAMFRRLEAAGLLGLDPAL